MNQVSDYVRNPEKTQAPFVTGINCQPDTAPEEMDYVKKQFGKEDGILAHHVFQSFLPGEITPGLAHQLGIELATRLWADRFQVVIATHLDKAHIHNHLLLNSVSFVDGKKYNGCKKTYAEIRSVSDALCREYGLSVINHPKYRGKSRAEWEAEHSGRSTWRSLIRDDIDLAIQKSRTMSDFYRELRHMHYDLKMGKHFALRPAGKERYIRLRSLNHEAYTLEGIRKRIAEQYATHYGQISKPRRYSKKCYASAGKPKRKLPKYKALYYVYLFQLGKIKQKRPTYLDYRIKEEIRYLEQISEQAKLIAKYNIQDESGLQAILDTLEKNCKSLQGVSDPEQMKQRNTIQKEIRTCRRIQTMSKRLAAKNKLVRESIKQRPKEEIKKSKSFANFKGGKEHER
ncbi:relaxase/mobilization nuclease domain-containing protein [Zhenpiania hominis]|uniref:Relaxase/mobilization nuclease domain-containing protein n=1 Tax=Zhenpiania hominis TaxID=2763644 RepID=A0A923NKC7_9FIRM|nr:relaxase/mobilization nuclease domain-containing protein [Zhenpiania hominis]MBC6679551.1 relaxase/mobilization nuclease domain-containing protein [Zhenpiania hominis]